MFKPGHIGCDVTSTARTQLPITWLSSEKAYKKKIFGFVYYQSVIYFIKLNRLSVIYFIEQNRLSVIYYFLKKKDISKINKTLTYACSI